MSAYGLKPAFKNKEEYKAWRKQWAGLYKELSESIRKLKHTTKAAQRNGEAGELQNELRQERIMAHKAMTLLEEAKMRWQHIRDMERGINEQFEQYPLVIEEAKNLEFHFNKKHLEFPDKIPMWVVKAKGKTYYVSHVDCETPWTTRENPDHPSTKGSIRIKRGSLSIDVDGNARIY